MEDPARVAPLLAGADVGLAKERPAVEDGHGGGRVLDAHDVRVGGVDGQGQLHVEEGDEGRRFEPKAEAGEVDGKELELGILGPNGHHDGGGSGDYGGDSGGSSYTTHDA